MKSPFAIFRKHQKLLTVILTGMAMFAFVILGAVQDPSSMPPGLIVIAVAAIVGAVAWLMGLQSGKSSEYGVVGLILGAILGIGFNLAGGPQDVVLADTGNIDARQLNDLQYRRSLANGFLQEAYFAASQNPQTFVQHPQPFGFGSPDVARDVVLGELLRREADRLGLTVTDSTVNEYIKAVFNDQIRAPNIREIRDRLRVSETDLYDVLKDELLARITAQYLYGGIPLPPESYWEFYRQMNVKQDAAIVPVDVREFVDVSTEPDENELLSLFAKYQRTFPNTTEDGQPEEGRPGFRQPRKVRLAFVEAAYTDIEQQVAAVTDDQIEAYYAENFKTTPPAAGDSKAGDAGPVLPDLTPDEDATPPTEPAPQGENEPKAPEAPASEQQEPEGETFLRPSPGLSVEDPLQVVALFDEDKPAEGSTSDEAAKADDTGTPETPESSEGQIQLESGRPPAPPVSSPAGTAPLASGSAPPALPGPRPLDDDLRNEIRDTLLRERTQERMEMLIAEVDEYMSQTLALAMTEAEDSPEYLTRQQATEQLQKFAAERGLHYAETPLMSAFDLQRSEEYPIGSAVDQKFGVTTDVVNQVFSSSAEQLYRAEKAVDPQTDSQFVYWKIEDVESFIPEDMTDPEIRRQVVDAWRLQQAREKARTRAEEIAAKVRESDEELSVVLANETVTGSEGDPHLTVIHPSSFSWLTKADPRLSPNPFNTPPPRLTELPSVPGMIGTDFMDVVFNQLQPGDVGVAHSFDKAYLYVVKVGDRWQGGASDQDDFRQKFLKEPLFGPAQFTDYGKLAISKTNEYQTDWSRQLFAKHNVQWRELPDDPVEGEEG